MRIPIVPVVWSLVALLALAGILVFGYLGMLVHMTVSTLVALTFGLPLGVLWAAYTDGERWLQYHIVIGQRGKRGEP